MGSLCRVCTEYDTGPWHGVVARLDHPTYDVRDLRFIHGMYFDTLVCERCVEKPIWLTASLTGVF